jgi:hypothetical protein
VTEVTVDPQPLLDMIAGGFDQANSVVVSSVAANEVHRTGRLAASFNLSETYSDGRWWWVYVRSALPYALPVERGAWVGAGHNRPSPRYSSQRGPHMKGNFRVKKTVLSVYGGAMKAALPAGFKPRRTTMRAAKIVYK